MTTIVEREVLARIRPGPLPGIVHETVKQVQEALPDADVMLGGSAAKGTNLADDHDVDVFIRFAGTNGMSDRLETTLAELFGVERVHGSRDYFHAELDDWSFEFVPVKRIEDWRDAENVTDVSPLHVAYVKDNIGKLDDDVRLLKQFCKAASVYGAESYIGGFSGYVLEVLVIHYGGFRKTLEAAEGWKEEEWLDPGEHGTELDKSKTVGPLTIIDPVQPDRNVAAAVTEESYTTLKERAAAYLAAGEDVQEGFFIVTPLDEQAFRKRHPKETVIAVKLIPLDAKHDVAAAKCRKVVEYIERQLGKHGFEVRDSAWEFDEDALALFAVRPGKLPPEKVVEGPPDSMAEDVKRFQETHDDFFLEDGRWKAREKRQFRTPERLIEHLVEDEYVQNRVRDVRTA